MINFLGTHSEIKNKQSILMSILISTRYLFRDWFGRMKARQVDDIKLCKFFPCKQEILLYHSIEHSTSVPHHDKNN